MDVICRFCGYPICQDIQGRWHTSKWQGGGISKREFIDYTCPASGLLGQHKPSDLDDSDFATLYEIERGLR